LFLTLVHGQASQFFESQAGVSHLRPRNTLDVDLLVPLPQCVPPWPVDDGIPTPFESIRLRGSPLLGEDSFVLFQAQRGFAQLAKAFRQRHHLRLAGCEASHQPTPHHASHYGLTQAM